jgi:hypothetical protein
VVEFEPFSIFITLFETVAIAYTKKTEYNEWKGLLLKAALITMVVNFIVVNVYLPEVPGPMKIVSFFAPTPVKLFVGAYDLFRIVSIFMSEVVIRGVFIILLFRGNAGDFTNSFIISLAKNVIVTMAGSFGLFI